MTKFLQIILATALFTPFPIAVERAKDGSFLFGVDFAHADKGSDSVDDGDNSGRDRPDDDDDDDDDDRFDSNSGPSDSNSGPSDSDSGTSGSNSGPSDRNEEPTDNSGRASADSGDNSRVTSNDNGRNTGKNSPSQQQIADLHLRFPNGWDEQILNGQYSLIDPEGRTVSNRRATQQDLARMRALIGQ